MRLLEYTTFLCEYLKYIVVYLAPSFRQINAVTEYKFCICLVAASFHTFCLGLHAYTRIRSKLPMATDCPLGLHEAIINSRSVSSRK